MTRLKRKKKVFLYCNKVLEGALDRELGNIFEIFKGKTVSQIKEYKPNTVIFDKDVESVLKYTTKKTYLFFLSIPEVFSGISEIGFQSKDNVNPSTKEGKEAVSREELIQQREKFLILRLASLITKEELNDIKKSIQKKIPIDNRIQLYPMYPDDTAKVIDTLLSLEAKGIVHLRGSEKTTKYKIGTTLAELLRLNRPESSYEVGGDVNIKLAGIILPTVIRQVIKDFYRIR